MRIRSWSLAYRPAAVGPLIPPPLIITIGVMRRSSFDLLFIVTSMGNDRLKERRGYALRHGSPADILQTGLVRLHRPRSLTCLKSPPFRPSATTCDASAA